MDDGSPPTDPHSTRQPARSSDSDAARIRPARPDDAAGIRDIYAPFVRDSPATFRTEVPPIEEVATEIRETRAADAYPWYVAVRDGGTDGGPRTVGYAYAGRLRDRAAYRWIVETSIYVDPARHRDGVGTRLYDRLLGTLEAQGYCSAYAAIATPNPESVCFHERHGFERVGTFPDSGFKLGEWHDVTWYHRRLRDPSGEPAAPEPVSAVDADHSGQ